MNVITHKSVENIVENRCLMNFPCFYKIKQQDP